MSKVKIIDKKSEKCIKAEREFLSKLHHPFIVNMICAFQDYENLYLVMDLLTGGDLRYHYCRIRRFTEEETKFFTSCLLLGLEYIHSNNIIHRDIKPENLVCDQNGYIRITDFGIAKNNKGDNSTETSGTPGYMAPEILLGKNYTFTVDFFAIGVVGYEFLMGKRPYNGNNRKQIKNLVLKSQIKIDKEKVDWSEESVDFINRCLKRKESRRLGYTDGIKELKSHKWFEGFDWDALYNKTLSAPFIPKKDGNYDKSYCELEENCGKDTKTRYASYTNRKNYENLFFGYTYVNLDLVRSTISIESSIQKEENSNRKKKINSNKKERIKNNNMIIKSFLNKRKNLLNNDDKKNNNIIINNYNNVNVNVNSFIINKNYYSSIQKKLNNKSEKNIKKHLIEKLNDQGIEVDSYNSKKNKVNNNKGEKSLDKNMVETKDYISEKINNISDNKIKKKKYLSKSPSFLCLISTPPNGKKLKLDKNNSFLHLKQEVNLFSYNNMQNNYNLNDTNLSNLLSSNSIMNLNNVFKAGLKRFNNSKEKKLSKMKSSSIEQSFSFPKSNSPKYNKYRRVNKKCDENYRKYIKRLSNKIKNSDLSGSNNDGKISSIPRRNNSCLKLKFKSKKHDNTFLLNSTLLSPLNKNDHSNIIKNFNSTTNRRIKINKNNNYIQLRQTNKNSIKNKILFYLPNAHKINTKRNFHAFNISDLKNKGKMAILNFQLKMKNNSKVENKILEMKNKKESMKMKRSISSLLLSNEIKLERKIDNSINNNIKVNEKNNNKINFINAKNKIRKKLIRNSSEIF